MSEQKEQYRRTYIGCSCGDERHFVHLYAEYREAEPIIELTLSNGPWPWRQRLKNAWNALRGRTYDVQNVILEAEEAAALRAELDRFLGRADREGPLVS